MFFKQAPSKVCISIFFSVAFVFAVHLYFGGGEEKGLYLCLCGDHWPLAFSLKAAFSFSEGSTSFATDRKFALQQVQIQKSFNFATFVSQLRRGTKNTQIFYGQADHKRLPPPILQSLTCFFLSIKHTYIQNLKRTLLRNISTFVERFISISEMIDMTSTKAYPDKIKYTSVLPKYNTT